MRSYEYRRYICIVVGDHLENYSLKPYNQLIRDSSSRATSKKFTGISLNCETGRNGNQIESLSLYVGEPGKTTKIRKKTLTDTASYGVERM